MSNLVADSSVLAKWILPEVDSPLALRVLTETLQQGNQVIILDLAMIEVANAIWKRHHQGIATLDQCRQFLSLLKNAPVQIEPAIRLIEAAWEIAAQYDCAVYDSLFVALSKDLGIPGITADEPLHRAIRADFPDIFLLSQYS